MVEAKCKYFQNCNGCSTQHIDYENQLEIKRKKLFQLIPFENIKLFKSPPFNYRNRLDLLFHKNGLGLRSKFLNSPNSSIVDIDRCEIVEDKIKDLIIELREFFTKQDIDFYDIKKKSGTFQSVILRCSDINSDNIDSNSIDSACVFVLNSNSTRLGLAYEQIENFSKITTVNNIAISYVPVDEDLSYSNDPDDFYIVKGERYLKKRFLDKEFHYPIECFFQNNHKVANEMLIYVKDLLEKYETKNSTLVDLYSGVGTFGLLNSDIFSQVILVENVPPAVEAMQINIKNNNIQNAKYYCLDAKHFKRVEINNPTNISTDKNLFIVTDPPRVGMDQKTIDRINELSPKVVVYISCNPKQLAKDILKFKNYEINSLALFDMFPQTNHMEVVLEFVKKEN